MPSIPSLTPITTTTIIIITGPFLTPTASHPRSFQVSHFRKYTTRDHHYNNNNSFLLMKGPKRLTISLSLLTESRCHSFWKQGKRTLQLDRLLPHRLPIHNVPRIWMRTIFLLCSACTLKPMQTLTALKNYSLTHHLHLWSILRVPQSPSTTNPSLLLHFLYRSLSRLIALFTFSSGLVFIVTKKHPIHHTLLL